MSPKAISNLRQVPPGLPRSLGDGAVLSLTRSTYTENVKHISPLNLDLLLSLISH